MSDAIVDEIVKLKRDRNAVVIAHYYQESEIQDLADFLGDSLAMAQYAQKSAADVLVVAGVKFMAETAELLNPSKTVVLPDLEAGCSLADGCPAPAFAAWRQKYPDHAAVTYINCSVQVKALSDVICTSSNAVKVIESIPPETPILFAPDRNLGRYLQQKTGRPMRLWQGVCIVHETFSQQKLIELVSQHPEAEVLAHPECEEPVLRMADFIGSTSALLARVSSSKAPAFIVATEAGILHQMHKEAPDKKLIPLPGQDGCGCNNCPHMKRNTLEKLRDCLRDLRPAIEIDEAIAVPARRSVQRMMEISARP